MQHLSLGVTGKLELKCSVEPLLGSIHGYIHYVGVKVKEGLAVFPNDAWRSPVVLPGCLWGLQVVSVFTAGVDTAQGDKPSTRRQAYCAIWNTETANQTTK